MDLSFLGGMPSLASFARASTATRFNASGLLETVAANAPRLDFDPVSLLPKGLLIEEQRTNYVTSSANLNNWGMNSTTLNTQSGGMDGGTAYGVVPSTANSLHRVLTPALQGQSANALLALTVFMKYNGGVRYVYINADAYMNATVAVDLTNGSYVSAGSKTNTVSVKKLNNGYWAVSFCGVYNGAWSYIALQANTSLAAADQWYTGDGVSSFIVGGMQVEVGAYPTSYIPTVSTTVTRAADIVAMARSSFVNGMAGAMVVDYVPEGVAATGVYPRVVSLNDGTTSNEIALARMPSNLSEALVTTGGVSQAALTVGTEAVGAVSKIAMSYAANNVLAAANGGGYQADTSATLPVTSTVQFGQVGGASFLNGWLLRFRYWNKQLDSTTLTQVTL